MNKLLIILLLGLTISSCAETSIIQKITLVETVTNYKTTSLKKILMIGAGSIETRFFLDQLAIKLKKDLAKEKVQLDYNYLGKINRDSKIDINKTIDKNYEATIVFSPIDTSKMIEISNSYPSIDSAPFGSGYALKKTVSKSMIYLQRFNISIYDNNLINLWGALLNIGVSLNEDKIYSNISKKIIGQIKLNNLIK